MLIGKFTNTLDAKYRLTIPSKLKDELTNDLIIKSFPSNPPCLQIFSSRTLKGIVEDELKNEKDRLKIRAIQAKYFLGAYQAKVDPQGRVTIPKACLDFIGVETEVVLSGMFDCVEIWKKEDYDQYEQNYNYSFSLDQQALEDEQSKRRSFQANGDLIKR